jgi:cell division protein FtsB
MAVVVSSGWEENQTKPSMKFWLLTPTWNQVWRLAMSKTVLRKEEEEEEKKKEEEDKLEEENNNNNDGDGDGDGNSTSNNRKPKQKLNHRLQQVADYQSGDCLKERTQEILLSVQQEV